jgi:hypothetical protein
VSIKTTPLDSVFVAGRESTVAVPVWLLSQGLVESPPDEPHGELPYRSSFQPVRLTTDRLARGAAPAVAGTAVHVATAINTVATVTEATRLLLAAWCSPRVGAFELLATVSTDVVIAASFSGAVFSGFRQRAASVSGL